MDTVKKILIFIILLFFAFPHLFSQEKEQKEKEKCNMENTHKQAINMCPGGIALGIFSANYERLFKEKHGLVLRMDYEIVPKTYSAANINPYGMAVILNYRYHLCGGMKSVFLGAYSRYREYRGKGNLNNTEFKFNKPDLTLGLNLGKRWVWKSGFTITAAFGYGFSIETKKIQANSTEIRQSIKEFEDSYDFINPFYGEISIGYAF